MKILVVGSGGREHALVWKLAQSPLVREIIAAPGNAGISREARCEDVSAEDIDGQIALAEREKVDLVVIGPEAPLVGGLADRLCERGIRAFGPSRNAAELEGSKAFAKEFMARHNIPTATFSIHSNLNEAYAAIEARPGPCVVKADGLAAGKGVILCRTSGEARRAAKSMISEQQFGAAGNRVIIEDCLSGEEASMLAICDGENFVPLILAQDHKAAFEGDVGPNTGGMGAYAPIPKVAPTLRETIISQIIKPTVEGMAEEGRPFKGVLYAGLMIAGDKPYVLEYNVRFGDPECQPLLLMMDGDLVPVMLGATEGNLQGATINWRPGAALCVVLAAGGYPGSYQKGLAISGLDGIPESDDVKIFHAGTKIDAQTKNVVTAGGRVLGVTAYGSNIGAAAELAYARANSITWEGMRMRRDIGHRAL